MRVARRGRGRRGLRRAPALATTELVGVASGGVGGESYQLEELCDARPTSTAWNEIERVERVRQLRADLPTRVQRRVRVLKDHLKPRQLTRPRAPRERSDFAALEDDGSSRRAHEPDGRAGKTRLPAAGLAYETHDLTALDGEACARDRGHTLTPTPLVDDLDVSQLQRRTVTRHRRMGPRGMRGAAHQPEPAADRSWCRRRSHTGSAGGRDTPEGSVADWAACP
jgi:hypothetical protein